MRVIPVAGHDSMLLNLSGAHAPFFTRNVVLLTDNAGRTGVGEVPGGEKIRRVLEEAQPLVVGQPLAAYNAVLNAVRRTIRGSRRRRPRPSDIRSAHDDPRASLRSSQRCSICSANFSPCPSPRFWAKASSAPASKCSAIYFSWAIDEDRSALSQRAGRGRCMAAAATRGSADDGCHRCDWPRPRKRATDSTTSSSRAACYRGRAGDGGRRCAGRALSECAHHARPERRMVAR